MRIKSKSRYSDTLIITSGAKTMQLQVDLDLCACAQALRKARQVLAEAQNAAQAMRTEQTAAAYGQALRSLIAVVFGENQADALVEFYQAQPASLIEDVMPYIFRRIVPQVNLASQRRAAELRRSAKAAAKGRRK